jgi:hypothetical protein
MGVTGDTEAVPTLSHAKQNVPLRQGCTGRTELPQLAMLSKG